MNPMLMVGVVVALVGVGAFALWPKADPAATPAATDSAATPTDPAAPRMAKADPPTPEIIAATEAQAKFGPRTQATLPPIPFQGYEPPRSRDVITAAYQFTAEHPEISSYIPCFCGCQQGGHKGNTDCFVRERAPNGDVIAWDEHGVECAVCIDVATRSRQMFASGASVRDIRAAVEKEFGPSFTTMTPTPKPPPAVTQTSSAATADETHNH